MKRIMNEWKQFLKEFKMDDKYQDTNVVNKAQVQAEVQKLIDQNSNLHASGRPINPQLLNKTLKENKIEDIIEKETDIRQQAKVFDGLKFAHFASRSELAKMLEIIQIARGEPISLILDNAPELKEVWEELVLSYDLATAKKIITHNIDITHKFALLYQNSFYSKLLISLALFTGSSVATTREPDKFNPSKANKSVFQKSGPFQTSGVLLHSMGGLKIENLNVNYRRMYELFYLIKRFFLKEQVVNDMEDSASSLSGEMYNDLKDFIYFMATEVRRKFITIEKISDPEKPTKRNYQDANTILTTLARIPNEMDFRIFRGMTLPVELFEKMEALLEGGDTLEFEFYDLSSWSTSLDIAEGFSKDVFTSESYQVIFSTDTPKRGVYIGEYSMYTEEQEFITGGKVLVEELHRLHDETIILRCKQI